MNAAASSWRTCMKRTRSCLWRKASMMPLMPSPGRPKTVSTPQSMMLSMSTSAAVSAIARLLFHLCPESEGLILMRRDVERELQLVSHTNRAVQSRCRVDVVIAAIHGELTLRSKSITADAHPCRNDDAACHAVQREVAPDFCLELSARQRARDIRTLER